MNLATHSFTRAWRPSLSPFGRTCRPLAGPKVHWCRLRLDVANEVSA
jgi:hypothetical protein